MDAGKARKRPVVVDYVEMTDSNGAEVAAWCGGEWDREAGVVLVPTIPGQVRATADGLRYIVQGTHGEYYPIRPDVYAEVYSEVGGPGMRLYPQQDTEGIDAVCDCGKRCPGWSVRDAVTLWALHVTREHRDEL